MDNGCYVRMVTKKSMVRYSLLKQVLFAEAGRARLSGLSQIAWDRACRELPTAVTDLIVGVIIRYN